MMRILILLTIFSLNISFSHNIYGQTFPGNTDGTIGTGNGTGGGGCSWDQFLEQLGCQETGFVCGGGACPKSCDKQYTTISPRADDPSWGKWQFTPATWRKYTNDKYPQCQGMQNAISVECRPAQKWATEQMMNDAVEWMKKNDWCGAKLGRTITGTHQGTTKTCTVNKSGLLSAYHNAGTNACVFVDGSSKWTSQINWRVCDAANIPFPENCTPNDTPPTISEEVTPGTPNIPPAEFFFEKPNHFNSLSESLKYVWVATFQLMTSQLSTAMIQQIQVVGSFFDAKHQLETQRLMQEKYAQAHKDYQPSVQMCEIGTFVRNLADSEKRTDLTKTALSRAMLDRALGTGAVKTGGTGNKKSSDEDTRLKAFIEKFCVAEDNAKQNAELCKDSVAPPEQKNADINFTQTIDSPLTINLNLLDTTVEKEEETLFAFIDYIFMHDRFPFMVKRKTILNSFVRPYQDMRSLIAMRSVAQNSFSHIIAEKTQGPDDPEVTVAPFLKALMREMGMQDDDIEERIGKNPSYFAQMEILTKKIYQHPEFISNLYDKPANVKRIRAAMTAIKLMQDRDIHEALMRREMLMSILLEIQLRKKQEDLTNREIRDLLSSQPKPAPSGGGSPLGDEGF